MRHTECAYYIECEFLRSRDDDRSHINFVARREPRPPEINEPGGNSLSAHDAFLQLQQQMRAGIIGQEAVIDRVLVALLANGHVLMEGLPGLAKTRTIKTLAKPGLRSLRPIRTRVGQMLCQRSKRMYCYRPPSPSSIPLSSGH